MNWIWTRKINIIIKIIIHSIKIIIIKNYTILKIIIMNIMKLKNYKALELIIKLFIYLLKLIIKI